MKILHSADWHLGSPLLGLTGAQKELLSLETIPARLAELCRTQGCQLVLLAGDLLDGPCSRHTCEALSRAFRQMEVPVFISPGNHDPMGPDSPWDREIWPENVYIFSRSRLESVPVPELDCRIYGGAFTGMDCPSLLEGFHIRGPETWHIGLMHGDPVNMGSPYNPILRRDVENSGLHYLALGHIHKGGSFQAGNTLCAWPGCPVGRGYDETGEKGALIVSLEREVRTEFVSLGGPRFQDLQADITQGPEQALDRILPPAGSRDFYRITLKGRWQQPDLQAIQKRYAGVPYLELRDESSRPLDLWGSAGQDSFEGLYFGMLRERLEQAGPEEQEQLLLAAEISRQILEGQEVVLP